MTTPSEKDVILKSWELRDDISIIKEVAIKGKFIQLCIDYLAKKRRITLDESRRFFNETVNGYVFRLLNDKLVCKAEDILKNVNRDFRSIYYQYAFDTEDSDIKNLLLDHLKKKNAEEFDEEKEEYEFFWKILRKVSGIEKLHKLVNEELGKLNLERLYRKTDLYRRNLIVKTYYETRSDEFLKKLDKKLSWEYLLIEKHYSEIVIWSNINYKKQKQTIEMYKKLLHQKYFVWDIEKEMFETALNMIENPSEILRNSFTANGYIFPDEIGNVKRILGRLFTTESYDLNKSLIEELSIIKFLIENEYYNVLFEDFIKLEDLKDTIKDFPTKTEILNLIVILKSEEFETNESFLTISKNLSNYLKNENNSIIPFTEDLFQCNTLEELRNSEDFNRINKLTYLNSFIQKFDNHKSQTTITIEEMLKKFKNIDFQQITNIAGGQPISFGNEFLSQKYSQKFKRTYLSYLKQQRSAYAVYYFFLEQLKDYSKISKSQISGCTEIVTDLAISNYLNTDLVLHCIAFIEMIGFNTSNLRACIKLLKMLPPELEYEMPMASSKLIEIAEKNLLKNYKTNNEFPIRDYDAIMKVSKCFQYKKFPDLYLKSLAEKNDWWKLLLFIQYFDIPLDEIKLIMKHFKSFTIGNHFLRAISYDVSNEKIKRKASITKVDGKKRVRSKGESGASQTSGETITSSISSSEAMIVIKSNNQLRYLQDSDDLDIFAMILLSTNNIPEEKITSYSRFLQIIKEPNSYSTSINLMKNSILYNLPIFAVLAAVVYDENLDYYWAVWLAVSMDIFDITNTCKTEEEFGLQLIEMSIRNGYVRTLNTSFQLFYETNKFTYLTTFLQQTIDYKYTHETIHTSQLYFLAWSNETIELPLIQLNKDELMIFTVKLFIYHLKYNFTSAYHQKMLLEIICKSGMSDISPSIDFCLLKRIFELISTTKLEFDFEILLTLDEEKIHEYYNKICNDLLKSKYFEESLELSVILNINISEIIYTIWLNNFELTNGELNFDEYEKQMIVFSLSPELLINFYLTISLKCSDLMEKKYLILKSALDVIKKNHLLPNESFDRDQIEFDMILCYLNSNESIDMFNIYYSEYYEEILLNERFVLYKSFLELKELAGVDDLITYKKIDLTKTMKVKFEILLNKLLDDGDIVEALRLQAMFNYRPLDLHFIVFCMALAEGLTIIYNLSNEERHILTDVEKSSLSRFNRRTLGRLRNNSTTSTPSKQTTDGSDNNSTLEFEEFPSREKQDILEALQGLASRLKHGINLGKRIVMAFRASIYLDKEYLDVLKTKDAFILLKSAIEEDCHQKLLIISDIFISTQMSQHEIAEFLASEIVTSVIRPRFYIFRTEQITNVNLEAQNNLWGLDLDKDFHLILELIKNTTLLGNSILDYCDTLKIYRKFQDNKNYEQDLEENPNIINAFDNLREIIRKYGLPSSQANTSQVLSHKKQNTIYVELLIKSHDCFVHECSMEGIANVLSRAKLLNSILTTAKSWKLIVRMLIGIGRYREMYYCFDTLIKNDQFEALLGQFDEKANGLRQAIITYIHEHCPENQEYFKLAGLHFLMYKELAEMWENEANAIIASVVSQFSIQDELSPTTSKSVGSYEDRRNLKTLLKSSTDILTQLNRALENFTQATENYLLDNKLRLAQKSVSNAELIAVQIDLVNKGLGTPAQNCICILSIRSQEVFRELINKYLSVPQSVILEKVYPYEINWPEAILNRFIIMGNIDYITDYCDRMELTDVMIESIAKSFQIQTPLTQNMDINMSSLVERVQSVSLRYKLASILGYKRIVTNLINDQSLYYLKDTNYGRNECDFSTR